MSYYDLYTNLVHHLDNNQDNASPNLYVKETVASLVEYAKSKGPGKYSLEIERYPHIHMNIQMREDCTFDMEIVNGNVHPDYLSVNVDPFRTAFKWYEQDSTSDNVVLSYDGYLLLYDSIIQKINMAVQNHHGIVCTQSISVENRNERSIVLHFSDMLVIKMREHFNMPLPEITMATESLSEIPDKLVCHLFDNVGDNNTSLVNLAGHESFTDIEKEFVFKNSDFFYYMYGSWHNYSNKPIRITCIGIQGMLRAQHLMLDGTFVRHQLAKFNELERKCHGRFIRDLYLLD